jgi:DNA-binding response OmpR family regulator
VDLAGGTARRGSVELPLTATEFRILALLASKPGKIVSQSQIAGAVWSTESGPESNAVEVHVARLRRKLDEKGAAPLLHTVRGMGYTLRNGGRR